MNKIKKYVLMALLFSGSYMSHAVGVAGFGLDFGIKGAMTFNKADVGEVNFSGTAESSEGLFTAGYSVGAAAVLDLNLIAVEVNFLYAQRNYDIETDSSKNTAKLSSIEIPVLAYYKVTLPLVGFRLGGGVSYIRAIGDFEFEQSSGTTTRSYEDSNILKNDFALLAAVGMDFSVPLLGTITADVRYAYGLTDRDDGAVGIEHMKNQNIDLMVGLLF